MANTIAHELNHWRSWLKGGIAPKDTVYLAGDALESYIKGEGQYGHGVQTAKLQIMPEWYYHIGGKMIVF